jgi:hypothetical protein
MPAGITNPGLGYASFCLVKFAGYSLAAHYISRSYGRADLSAWRVGGTRTLIGMAAGAGYFGAWWAAQLGYLGPLSRGGQPFSSYWYLIGLLPVRVVEWWLLIWLFYDRDLAQRAKGWRTVALGTAWSYALDAPAIAGFIATAGVWVC